MGTRYFQLDETICSTAQNPDHTHDATNGWVEVKVVPIDAVVVAPPAVVVTDELPEVTRKSRDVFEVEGRRGSTVRLHPGETRDDLKRAALELLAVVAHLDATPTSAEERAAEALWSAAVDVGTDMDLPQARRLIEQGWRRAPEDGDAR